MSSVAATATFLSTTRREEKKKRGSVACAPSLPPPSYYCCVESHEMGPVTQNEKEEEEVCVYVGPYYLSPFIRFYPKNAEPGQRETACLITIRSCITLHRTALGFTDQNRRFPFFVNHFRIRFTFDTTVIHLLRNIIRLSVRSRTDERILKLGS